MCSEMVCPQALRLQREKRDAQDARDLQAGFLWELSEAVATALHKLPREDRTRIEAALLPDWRPEGEMFRLAGAKNPNRQPRADRAKAMELYR